MKTRRYSDYEDNIIRTYAGIKSAEEIGQMLARSRSGIHYRVKKLGLSGHLYGEHHWNSKVDNLKMSMIHTLLDANFTVTEIHTMFAEPMTVSKNYLSQLSCCSYRLRG